MPENLKNYRVEITNLDLPGDTPSVEEFSATRRNDAIKQARRLMRRAGHLKQDGRISYRAARGKDSDETTLGN